MGKNKRLFGVALAAIVVIVVFAGCDWMKKDAVALNPRVKYCLVENKKLDVGESTRIEMFFHNPNKISFEARALTKGDISPSSLIIEDYVCFNYTANGNFPGPDPEKVHVKFYFTELENDSSESFDEYTVTITVSQ